MSENARIIEVNPKIFHRLRGRVGSKTKIWGVYWRDVAEHPVLKFHQETLAKPPVGRVDENSGVIVFEWNSKLVLMIVGCGLVNWYRLVGNSLTYIPQCISSLEDDQGTIVVMRDQNPNGYAAKWMPGAKGLSSDDILRAFRTSWWTACWRGWITGMMTDWTAIEIAKQLIKYEVVEIRIAT